MAIVGNASAEMSNMRRANNKLISMAGNRCICHAIRSIILLMAIACLPPRKAASQAPAFRVIAFFTAKEDLAHISFVNEANRWFAQAASKYHFGYEATTN